MHPGRPEIPDHDLLHPIGRGSYGEVWVARSVLGTLRAVKVVCQRDFPESRPFEREFHGLRRFEPVSRAHPALVDVLQVGRNDAEGYYYYVMELADAVEPPVAGSTLRAEGGVPSPGASSTLKPQSATYTPRTLRHDLRTRGRLPSTECLDLGLALAGALEHLHQHGLIHRDVKPSNVIFVNGRPKLADIGLVAGIDEARSFVGTEGFVPPEGPGTPQADLYSAGKLLYEAVMGRSRLEFPALPADWDGIPPEEQERLLEFNEVLLKACESNPRKRYASAGELRGDLERLARGGSVRRQRTWERVARHGQQVLAAAIVALLAGWGTVSLVREQRPASAPAERGSVFVLPFRGEGTNTVPGDLRERITDAFIDALAVIEGVRRSPRKSGWIHRDEVELLHALARTNDFRHVLCGQVRQAGGELVLVLQLWNRRNGQAIWGEAFAGPTNRIVALERRVLETLTGRLGLAVTPEEWAVIDRTLANNLAALEWFRKAIAVYEGQGGSQPASTLGMDYCQKARRLDPWYVTAQALDLYMKRSLTFERATVEAWRDVGDQAERVLARDDTVALAWDQKAGAALVVDGDWATFEACYARLLEVVPDSGHSFLRAWYLRICGHLEAAQCEQAWSEAGGPSSADTWLVRATSRWVQRDFKEAVAAARQALVLRPDNYDLQCALARCLVAEGDYHAAIQVIEKGQALWKGRELASLLACAYAGRGDLAKAREVLQGMLALQGTVPYVQPYFVARVYTALGEKAAALDWLEKAAKDRSEILFLPDLGGLRTDPAWDALQDEPRYWQICDQVGLGLADWPRKEFLP